MVYEGICKYMDVYGYMEVYESILRYMEVYGVIWGCAGCAAPAAAGELMSS